MAYRKLSDPANPKERGPAGAFTDVGMVDADAGFSSNQVLVMVFYPQVEAICTMFFDGISMEVVVIENCKRFDCGAAALPIGAYPEVAGNKIPPRAAFGFSIDVNGR